MVNQKFVLLALIVLFVLIACASENISTDEPVIATLTNTAVIPSSTSVPTKTKTPTPTATLISPTATLYLTPFPTLSIEQERVKFYQFYNFINGCHLPCLWGITPGVTTWTEMKQFIDQFYSWNYVEKAEWSITKSTTFDTYVWYVKNPNPQADYSSAIFLEVQNNVVTAISINGDLSTRLFPLDKLLTAYGQPNKILLDTVVSRSDVDIYRVYVLLVYEDQHIFSAYQFVELGSAGEGMRRVCLDNYLEKPMMLWSPGKELDVNFSKFKLMNEFSELDMGAFYNKFKHKGNKCFEILKDAWD